MSPTKLSLRRAFVMLLLSGTAACIRGDRDGRFTSPDVIPVDSIMRLRSDSFFLTVGDNAAIAATVASIVGDRAPSGTMRWDTDDPTVARVDTTGVVTGVGPGATRVVAQFENDMRVVVRVFVTSLLRPVSRLVVSPSTVNLSAGRTGRVTVQALDVDGVPVSGAIIAFASDSTQIATARVTATRTRELNQVFQISAVSPGTTRVTATSEATVASALVVVTAPVIPVARVTLSPSSATVVVGDTVRMSAQALDSFGNPVIDAEVAYSTDAPTVAVVDQMGKVTAVSPGVSRIRAISRGISVQALVTVTAAAVPVTRVTISPSPIVVTVGATSQVTASALDQASNLVVGASLAYVSNAPSIATVNQQGLVTAVAPGTAQLTVSSGNVSGSAQILISPRSVVQVIMTPAAFTLAVGAARQLSVQTLDNTGASVPGAVLLFATNAPSIATVTQTGVVTAVAPGSAQLSVSSQGVSAASSVTVMPGSVSQISLTPSNLTLTTGATAQLSALAIDNTGTPVPGAVIAFASSAGAVATVSQGGLVTAVSPGSAQITASSQGVSIAAPLVVTPRPVSQVVLTPGSLSLVAGTTGQLNAQALDNTGAAVPGATITFSSNATSIATVTQAGLVTAVAPGSVQISATSQGISAVTAVSVTSRPVAQVVLTPSSLSLVIGTTGQLTAQALDNTGAAVPGATITFASSATSIATVTQAGVVTAVATGSVQITATSQGVSATAAVTVSPRPVAQVVLTPSSISLVSGATAQLTAQARDNTGALVSGAVITLSSDATSIGTVTQTGLVTAVAPGSTTIRATSNGITATSALTVQATTGLIIDVATGTSFQTINGWEATAQIGEIECDKTAYLAYRSPLLQRAVDELGINRIRLEALSGLENTTDYFSQFLSGQITMGVLNANRYLPVNDNADPLTSIASRFKWTALDYSIDEIVTPLRQRLEARGEQLYVNLNFVDFKPAPSAFNQMPTPAEYAEFMAVTFQHIQTKYGWVPNGVELLLEPENTPWSGVQMGQAMVAAASRLSALGFTPEFIGPATTASANASPYWDAMRTVSGASALLKELSYHRYDGVTNSTLQGIDLRRTRDNVRTSMLEHIGSGIDDLFADLTVAGISAWQQFALAFCVPDDGSAYYVVNDVPANPTFSLSSSAGLLSQVFRYVRKGAVRVGATSANTGLANAVAFRNLTGKHSVVVRTQGAQQLQIRGLPAGSYGVNYATLNTANVSLADVVVTSGGAAVVSIPAAGAISVFAR